MCHLLSQSKIEFIDIGKVYTNIFKHLDGSSLVCGVGWSTYERLILSCYQHASWSVTILALTHFECCMFGLIQPMYYEMLKNGNKSKICE